MHVDPRRGTDRTQLAIGAGTVRGGCTAPGGFVAVGGGTTVTGATGAGMAGFGLVG